MSLKAKIEAVIYASEEPVTLTQLVGLLGEEAQAELDREAAAQQTLLVEAESDGVDLAEPTDGDETALNEAPALVDAAPEDEPTSENPDVGHPALGPDFDSVGGDGEGEAAETVDPIHGDETAMNGAPVVGDEAPDPTRDGEAVMTTPASEADRGPRMDGAPAKAERARATKLRAYFRSVLDRLVAEYAEADRGLEIREVAGGFRFATKPEYHDAVRGFVKSLKPPLKLTLQALETLAVVAYKQPVTAPEISEIRGVDSGGVLGSLMTRKLITTAGRKQVIGRPILYKTTKEFLIKFGLKDVAELPSIEEFEKMAGQMAEQEEIAMGDPETAKSEEERLESDAEATPPELVADEVVVDGRESGLPPRYDDAANDPSAAEAEIQESGEEG